MAWSRSHHQWVTEVQPNMHLHLQSHYFYLRCSNNYDSHKQNFQEQYWYFSKWIQRGNGWLSSHPSILFPSLNSPVILYGSHHRRTFISIILSQTHKKSSQKEQQPHLSKIFKWWFFFISRAPGGKNRAFVWWNTINFKDVIHRILQTPVFPPARTGH